MEDSCPISNTIRTTKNNNVDHTRYDLRNTISNDESYDDQKSKNHRNDAKKKEIKCGSCIDQTSDSADEKVEGPGALFSLQSCESNDTDSYTSPASLDLDKMMSRYSDNPELLQLLLLSKVEEDRRRAEEARLKQRELEYLLANKHHTSTNESCQTKKDKEFTLEGDNSREKNQITIDSSVANNTSYFRPGNKSYHDSENSIAIKRKIRDEESDHQILSSPSPTSCSKEEKDFIPLTSTYHLSTPVYDTTKLQTNQRSSHHQLFSSSIPTVNPWSFGSTGPMETTTRRLQSLDYLTSRKNSLDQFPRQIYRKSSMNINIDLNDDIQPNILPPISASLSSKDQPKTNSKLTSPFTFNQEPSNVARSPVNQTRRTGRIQSLPTLDSFEASIMETLPFDRNSDYSSFAKKEKTGTKMTAKESVNTTSFGKNLSLKQSTKDTQNEITTNKQRKSLDRSPSSIDFHTKKLPLPPNPSTSSQDSLASTNRPRRRRREMQAITMIIETRDFPYNDEYVWKNNGNTIHKSSGQKSIYYKCSNSNAGCPVNKTVTFRENGEYLIKYRGSHLDECSKIKRVIMPV